MLLLSQFGIKDLLIYVKEAAYGWMWMHADNSSPYLLFSVKMEDMTKHWYSKRTYDSIEDEYFEGYLIAYDERKRITDIHEFKQGNSR